MRAATIALLGLALISGACLIILLLGASGDVYTPVLGTLSGAVTTSIAAALAAAFTFGAAHVISTTRLRRRHHELADVSGQVASSEVRNRILREHAESLERRIQKLTDMERDLLERTEAPPEVHPLPRDKKPFPRLPDVVELPETEEARKNVRRGRKTAERVSPPAS